MQILDIVLFNDDFEKTKNNLLSIYSDEMYQNGNIAVYIMDMLEEHNENAGLKSLVKKNTLIFDVCGKSMPEIFNFALKNTKGDYISFVTDQGSYSPEALKSAINELSRSEIVSLHPYATVDGKLKSYLPGIFCSDNIKKCRVDLNIFPWKFHFCLSAFLFQKNIFDGISFDERMPCDSEWKVVISLLDKIHHYTLVNCSFMYSDADENDYFNYLPQFDKDWYISAMDLFLIGAVKKGDSKFKQRAILYLIECRYACNMNERDKSILSPEETEEFFDKTSQALQNIDDEIICNNMLNGKGRTPQFFALNLLRLKYKDDKLLPKIVSSGRNLYAYINDCLVWSLGGTKIEVKVTYFDGENLTMDGFFPGIYVFEENEIEIVSVLNQEEEYPVRRNHIYALNKFFNVSAKGNYTFQFSLPLSKIKNNTTIAFYLKYKGDYFLLPFTFLRAEAKLSNVANSYWIFDKYILSYDKKGKQFVIEEYGKKKHLKHEHAFIKTISNKTHGMWKIKMVGNRLLYWITRPFYRKKIWLTMDKIFKAGDNGEYFYRYVKKMNPKGVKIYYVVDKDSPDYKRLKSEYNTIVKFNTIHHKILALHTDLMLATHVDTMNCNGYYAATRKYFQDLYNARVVCLAHGLTIQKIAQYQNRVFDNTVLYFFASKYEIENVSHEIYDYYDKNALQLTGHARYDGLVSNDKKIILITPTWRRGITTGKANKGSTYSHSDSFKNSEYYHIYNNLINDKELIDCANKTGYKIVYLLHPAMSAQLEDFDKNDSVEIVAATSDISYEKILTESSLMVTDYSGVQFDFAYMKKPVVYYHPETLPPQYEAGGLVYETMGFGPICKNHSQVIGSLCRYMENKCQMEDMYKDRVDDFFKYSDHNNCARIYEKVIEFQNKFDKVNKVKK